MSDKDKRELSQASIQDLDALYNYSDHFNAIAKPRLRSLLYIKEVLPEADQLAWNIIYSPVNPGSNCVRLSLTDPHQKFHFFYEIPLLHKFELKLFLGDNTFNFFEAHPLLLEKGIIKEGDYNVSATLNTLPHLSLAPALRTFDRVLLDAISCPDTDVIRATKIYKAIAEAHQQFVSVSTITYSFAR